MVDLHALSFPLVFEDSLCDGRYDTVVPSLDLLQGLGEAGVVVVEFGRPVPIVGGGEVSSCGDGSAVVGIACSILAILAVGESFDVGFVLARSYTGVVGGFAENA